MKKQGRGREKRLPTADLEGIAEKARGVFSAKDAAREQAPRLCREVIRHSANAIRAVHRRELIEAEGLLELGRGLLARTFQDLAEHGDLLHGGLVHDAQKEFAEASITLALVRGQALPTPSHLGVSYPAYLNGLGETAGEMRRYLLDTLRRGEMARCEEVLEMMDDIYGVLVTMDFPDAITSGLRRTTDMVRGVLERTRGDLTLALEHRALEEKLEDLGSRIGGKKAGP